MWRVDVRFNSGQTNGINVAHHNGKLNLGFNVSLMAYNALMVVENIT